MLDITKFSVTELKAMVYDEMVLAEQASNNIKVLNAELQKRQSKPVPEAPTETSSVDNEKNG